MTKRKPKSEWLPKGPAPTLPPGRKVLVYLSDEQIAALDAEAKVLGIDRAKLIRGICEQHLRITAPVRAKRLAAARDEPTDPPPHKPTKAKRREVPGWGSPDEHRAKPLRKGSTPDEPTDPPPEKPSKKRAKKR